MTTKTVTINNAKKQLSELLKIVSKGNEVIIVNNDKPLARLGPIPNQKRVAGLNRGEISVSKDFDAQLPDEFWTDTK